MKGHKKRPYPLLLENKFVALKCICTKDITRKKRMRIPESPTGIQVFKYYDS